MPCFSPINGFRAKKINPNTGKRSIVFNMKKGYSDMPVKVPCGQCIGCRLERSRQWAIRCSHEASLHKNNCFITLTYSDEFLPRDKSLNVKHFQDFMKRLRKEYGPGIRFYHCGEYGEKYQRPHYHACLFNFDFPDKQVWKRVRNSTYYTSESLQNLWGFGYCTIGEVTFESAAYVARYILKKQTGKTAYLKYTELDYDTGEILNEIKPEYTTMSRKPGIAKHWFEQYHSDVYPDDFIVLRGKKLKPPKYYDAQFEILSPKELSIVKLRRKLNGEKHADNNTIDRLNDRRIIQELKLKQLKRGYEHDT